GVGLVTHPFVGAGEGRLGSTLDNLHMGSSIAPGMIAASRVAGRGLVVGKSMALRRGDLDALGGFDTLRDVLAEDYVLGRRVETLVGKRVVVGRCLLRCVSRERSLVDFVARYQRWSVIQ